MAGYEVWREGTVEAFEYKMLSITVQDHLIMLFTMI